MWCLGLLANDEMNYRGVATHTRFVLGVWHRSIWGSLANGGAVSRVKQPQTAPSPPLTPPSPSNPYPPFPTHGPSCGKPYAE